MATYSKKWQDNASLEELIEAYLSLKDLISQMVGTLYPRIIQGEIAELEETVAKRFGHVSVDAYQQVVAKHREARHAQ